MGSCKRSRRNKKESTSTRQPMNVKKAKSAAYSLCHLSCDGRWSSYHSAAVSYTWLGTMSFCNSDPAIPEICFTLFAHFSSYSCCQVCDQLSFPVWFSTSLSCNFWLVLSVPPNCNLPLVFMETGGKLGFLRESPVLNMQMPTNP